MIPTEPGYYWAQPLNLYVSRVPVIVKVVRTGSGKLLVEQFGAATPDLDQFTDWDGPIVQRRDVDKELYDLLATAEGCLSGIVVKAGTRELMIEQGLLKKITAMRDELKEIVTVKD